MKTFTLDANIMNIDAAREADMICFCPKQSKLLPCRAVWREVLIDALRRDVPVSAILEGFDGCLLPNEYDALCELLSYVSFIFLDSGTAALFLPEGVCEPEDMLRAIHNRFGVCSVGLTDRNLAFDGEKTTPMEV
ncbi:MAG: hypothetical protein ACI3XI_04485 [Eubacteriales bacterium]